MNKKIIVVVSIVLLFVIYYKFNVSREVRLIEKPYDLENSTMYYEKVIKDFSDKRLVERRFLERKRYLANQLSGSVNEWMSKPFEFSEEIQISDFGTYVMEAGQIFYSDMDAVKDHVFMCYISRDVVERTLQVYDANGEWVDYGTKKYKGLYYPHILTSRSGVEEDKVINCVYKAGFEPIYEDQDEGFDDIDRFVHDI